MIFNKPEFAITVTSDVWQEQFAANEQTGNEAYDKNTNVRLSD